MNADDVLVSISASGNSPNCVNAMEYANSIGGKTIALVGFTGGKMKELSTAFVHLPSTEYGPVEDGHMVINHIITEGMKAWLHDQPESGVDEIQ